MGKQETIEKILWTNTKMRTMNGGIHESVIGAGTIPTLAQEIEEALFPVGGHHDHMCPCGRDWETKKQIAKQIMTKYRKANEPLLQEDYRTISRIGKWLDEEKLNG